MVDKMLTNKEPKMKDYLTKIKKAKNRFEAADLIRAFACQTAAKLYKDHSRAARLSIVEQAHENAAMLEKDIPIEQWDVGDLGRVHPWKRWLSEWGYR
jgi:hypothetical protein